MALHGGVLHRYCSPIMCSRTVVCGELACGSDGSSGVVVQVLAIWLRLVCCSGNAWAVYIAIGDCCLLVLNDFVLVDKLCID